MAGGASVNVQVKSGTNTVAGSAFDHMTDYRMKAKNYFLPEGDPEGHRQHAGVRGNDRRSRLAGTRCSSSPASNAHGSAPTPAMRLSNSERQRPAQPTDDGHA
jgi:hypothetical protein